MGCASSQDAEGIGPPIIQAYYKRDSYDKDRTQLSRPPPHAHRKVHAEPHSPKKPASPKRKAEVLVRPPSPPKAPLENGDAPDASAPSQSKSPVKVAVVVRPLLPAEKAARASEVLDVVNETQVRLRAPRGPDPEGQMFEYDRVYKMVSKEAARGLFAELVQPLLDGFVKGFNATVFAYGQTGSGKTYVMGTDRQVRGASQPEAVIPRALKHIFDAMPALSADYDVTLKAEYAEIYRDDIRDLFAPEPSPREMSSRPPATPINLRESTTFGVFLENVITVDVGSAAQLAQLLEEGNARRAVAAHNLNDQSSRSHAVLTLRLEQRRKEGRAGAPANPQLHKFIASKLHLVDLAGKLLSLRKMPSAGSERVKDTGASGATFAEGVKINQGLYALGNVISALTEGASRKHIPYRDSKLTRILQDSLGGNSATLMISCCSPAHPNYEQSLSTLRYALRARDIQNRVSQNNKFTSDDEIAYLRKVVAEKNAFIAALQAEVAAMKSSKLGKK